MTRELRFDRIPEIVLKLSESNEVRAVEMDASPPNPRDVPPEETRLLVVLDRLRGTGAAESCMGLPVRVWMFSNMASLLATPPPETLFRELLDEEDCDEFLFSSSRIQARRLELRAADGGRVLSVR